MLHLSYPITKPNSILPSRFNLSPKRLPISHISPPAKNIISPSIKIPLLLTPRCSLQENIPLSSTTSHSDEASTPNKAQQQEDRKNYWGAVSLIIGTAVGPGMLGLPAATLRSGSFPSTIAILLCWVYVISSVFLVAELSFAAMQEDAVVEVSFTGLATKSLGSYFGAIVAVVYASLSFSLLVACVSGIGSLVSQWFPRMNLVLANALFPLAAGITVVCFPFKVIDNANRLLCMLMLFFITALVGIGLSVARTNVLGSLARSSWTISSILPAIPVTVLTLGFHVITPFVCKIAGDNISDARKAILIGGAVPLIMVLSWNLIVLGLAGANGTVSSNDPIALLLSVNPSALSAVQGFAFSALATSLIGYTVSFPKQILDAFDLVFMKINSLEETSSQHQMFSFVDGKGRVGLVTFSGGNDYGNAGRAFFGGSKYSAASEARIPSSMAESNSFHQTFVTVLILGVSVLIGSFFRSTFSRALDFAGVYANCFLFGILPPLMAHVQQSRKKLRPSILPGGDIALMLLFGIAVVLAIFH
ncbi:tyrosine-specific transport system [Ricinus communis]|uniref:Tyrosine-specific transport protein, putative n=1 Tax=Ricinus communis TaxID=3988 RepID=B9SHJ3_RICCO|nr:tyrosine-specific transport system [Ricinus communis]EEF36952.1 Tyrosine-specific transport protein, putative [Ricinus communis]|eukprot:XP_002525462.1 uncharacterized protein LOC8276542 [Ricinus communis]